MQEDRENQTSLPTHQAQGSEHGKREQWRPRRKSSNSRWFGLNPSDRLVSLHTQDYWLRSPPGAWWLHWCTRGPQLPSRCGNCWLVFVYKISNWLWSAQWTLWSIGCCWGFFLLNFACHFCCFRFTVFSAGITSRASPKWSMFWLRFATLWGHGPQHNTILSSVCDSVAVVHFHFQMDLMRAFCPV